MPREFTNHDVSEEVKAQRQKLCTLWEEDNILDCTVQAAKLVLVYVRALAAHKRKMAYIGKCLLTWEWNSYQTLKLIIFETSDDIADYQIKVLPDGKIEVMDQTFENPKRVLEFLTNRRQVVHKQIVIPRESTLAKLLDHTLDSASDIAFPQFPPLLLDIALANLDDQMAKAIIEHPFIDEPGKERKTNRRLFHILPWAVEKSIAYDNVDFLDYLIDRFDFLTPFWGDVELTMVAAVRCRNENIVKYLLDKYPAESRDYAFSKGLYAAASVGNKAIFDLILGRMEKLLEDEPKIQTSFLVNVFSYFTYDSLLQVVDKFKLKVDWEQWITEFINRRIDPRFYLDFYVKYGQPLKTLPQDLKNKIYLNALGTEDAEAALDHIRINFPDLGPISHDVLKGAFYSIDKLKILISLGLHPTHDDFEELIKQYQLGPERLNYFKVLLDGVESQASAKATLKIASAFGLDAMSMVFAKFPQLESDKEFLFGMLDQTWKGTIHDINAMMGDFVSLRPKAAGYQPDLSGDKKQFELPIEHMISPQITSQDISLNTLISVLLPTGQFEKIKTILLKNPELMMEFWWKVIFNGPKKFEDKGWDIVAKASLDKLDANQQAFLIRYGFQYGYPAFVEFLISQGVPFPTEKTFILFLYALSCDELRLIEILIEQGQIDRKDALEQSLLHYAVDKNQADMVALLLNKGARVDGKDYKGNTPYMSALQSNLVTICRHFSGEQAFLDIANHIISLEPPELEKWLIKAFLNSSSLDIFKLLKILEQKINELSVLNETKKSYQDVLKYIENFIETAGTLLVRLPNKENQAEMFSAYGTGYQSYEEQQQKWGAFCYQWYMKVFDEVLEKNLSFLEVMQLFAKPRDSLDSFQIMRTSNALTVGLITDLGGRYYPYWVLAQKIQREFHENPGKYVAQIKDTEKGYQVLTVTPEGIVVELTRIDTRKPFEKGKFRGSLVHSGVPTIQMVQPILAKEFEDIKAYHLDKSEEALPEELKRKIAYFFWLGCQTTPAERGSSQYMLMLHRMVYQMHGFQTAPWSQRYPFPDCVALVMPFETFYPKYYDSIMECPPKRIKVN